MKDWQKRYKAVPVSLKKDVSELLEHRVDVTWLWSHRYFIEDLETKKNYIYSDTDYEGGDGILYSTPFDFEYAIKNIENIECGRSKVQNGYLEQYFPYFDSYIKENNLV